MSSRMKISTVRVLVMMAVLALWSATGFATGSATRAATRAARRAARVAVTGTVTGTATGTATGVATTVDNLGGLTVTTSAQETIVFDFVKYADVTDVVTNGIHYVTLSTGCYSADSYARANKLHKIDYWLKTHRRGQTRVTPVR